MQKHLIEAVRTSADTAIHSHAAQNRGDCELLLRPVQPSLITGGDEALSASKMLEVVMGSVRQVHQLFRFMVRLMGRHEVSQTMYKEALDTIKYLSGSLKLGLSDKDWLLGLVQETMAVPLEVHCSMQMACQRAALARKSLVDANSGVHSSDSQL